MTYVYHFSAELVAEYSMQNTAKSTGMYYTDTKILSSREYNHFKEFICNEIFSHPHPRTDQILVHSLTYLGQQS